MPEPVPVPDPKEPMNEFDHVRLVAMLVQMVRRIAGTGTGTGSGSGSGSGSGTK